MAEIPEGFVTLAVLVVMIVLGLQLVAWFLRRRYGWGEQSRDRPDIIDGDRIYADDRVNELLYVPGSEGSDESVAPPDEPVTGTRCPECGTINEPTFEFCRDCAAALGDGDDRSRFSF